MANQRLPLKGLTYTQHVRFAIELEIVRSKAIDINQDIFTCYPERVWRLPHDISNEILAIKDLIGNQVFIENRNTGLTLRAKEIYSHSPSSRIKKYECINFSCVKRDFFPRKRTKVRFTKEEYLKIIARIDEIGDFFWFFYSIIRTAYPSASNLLNQIERTHQENNKFKESLVTRLKKEHGPEHEMFHESVNRLFLQNCLTDLTDSAAIILEYTEALKEGDWKTLEFLHELLSVEKATRPTDANQPAELQ